MDARARGRARWRAEHHFASSSGGGATAVGFGDARSFGSKRSRLSGIVDAKACGDANSTHLA
jgi:hypothetical protein